MKYKTLLFDLDNTILDFSKNELRSMTELFKSFNLELTSEIWDTYQRINHGLWRAYERGEITINDVLFTRFSKTLAEFNIDADGIAFENQYRINLGFGAELMDNAIEVLDKLSQSHRLYVVTNGVRKTQLQRMKSADLNKYFITVFDSESLGIQKPAKEFFDHVKSNIENFDDATTLIIGDSLGTDIKGGRDANLDTCLITFDEISSCEAQSTYVIHNLIELLNIV